MIKKLAGKQDTVCKLWPLELCERVKLDTPHCAVCYYSYIKFSCKTGFLFQLGCRNIFLSLLFMNTIRFTSKSWRSWKLESSLHESKCKPLKTPITVGFVGLLCYSLHFLFIFFFPWVIFSFVFQEDSMLEFQCHYREEKWLTPRYFEFVEDFFNTANSSREVEDCEPPPCPTTIKTKVTTTMVTAAPTQHHSRGGEEILMSALWSMIVSKWCRLMY